MLDDLIERARHRRQCRQSLDHRIAAANVLAVDDRVAVVIAHRPRRKTALIVFARFVELDGEAVLEVIEHIFPGRDRKRVVKGKSVTVRVDIGGRRIFTKKHNSTTYLIKYIKT